MINLRPHHLLCTQGYSGKGYSDGFVLNMNEVVNKLRNEYGTKIMLTFSTDSLCQCCPINKGENICATQEKVKNFDDKTVTYFALEEKEYVYKEIVNEIKSKITPQMLEDICTGCCWYNISACKKNICGCD